MLDATLIEAVLLGLAIGAVLGGLGGGGAILTVPALVYLLDQPAAAATTGSLVIVGASALSGVASYVASRQVRWRVGLVFGLVGLPGAWVGSRLNHSVDENVLLLGFAALMVVAAAAMVSDRIGGRRRGAPDEPPAARGGGSVSTLARTDETTRTSASPVAVAATALGVGLLTGFFGVGGGFVVVPALVVVLGLPLPVAVGTSLMIVAINSGTSLLSRIGGPSVDWQVVVPFALAAMVASVLGKQLASRLPARQLAIGFAALLVAVAGYTAWQSIDALTADGGSGTSSGTSSVAAPAVTDPTAIVTPAQAVAALDAGAFALDVRTPEEYAAGHLAGAANLDVSGPDFEAGLASLDRDASYVVYCASGNRAGGAVARMLDLGFTDVVNGGGFVDLAAAGVPTA
ncbi:TSUP family transporter [Nocardioides sp. YIM 152588]|uniref:TSUP family transporter n=1 Tax=Nocardioides sp. YIM 152588 TaxID=3158259 RepID=UPI0032E470EB